MSHGPVLSHVLWPCRMSYGPMALSSVPWPCPMSHVPRPVGAMDQAWQGLNDQRKSPPRFHLKPVTRHDVAMPQVSLFVPALQPTSRLRPAPNVCPPPAWRGSSPPPPPRTSARPKGPQEGGPRTVNVRTPQCSPLAGQGNNQSHHRWARVERQAMMGVTNCALDTILYFEEHCFFQNSWRCRGKITLHSSPAVPADSCKCWSYGPWPEGPWHVVGSCGPVYAPCLWPCMVNGRGHDSDQAPE